MLSKVVITRLYASDVTFDQLFQLAQKENNELYSNLLSLAENYNLLGEYKAKAESYEDAREAMNVAVVIFKKISPATDKMTESNTKTDPLWTEEN